MAIGTGRVDALASDRTALCEPVSNTASLKLKEKREAVSYAPLEGGEQLGRAGAYL